MSAKSAIAMKPPSPDHYWEKIAEGRGRQKYQL